MRVAIDIRRAGDYRVGAYIRNIVNQLARLDSATRHVLIGRRQRLEEFDIARGIRRILTEEVLREALVRRGHELVRRFSWESSARQVRAVYEAVCAGRAAAAAA